MSNLTAKERHTCKPGLAQIENVDFKPQLREGELLTGTPTVTKVTGTDEVTVSSEAVNTAILKLKGVDGPRDGIPGEVAQFKADYASTITVGVFVFEVTCDTIKGGTNPYRTLSGWIVVPVETAPTE